MRQNALGRLLILLLPGSIACGVLQPLPAITYTPDHLATGVADAKAITTTLTAAVLETTLTPIPTAAPSLSPTGKPMLTLTYPQTSTITPTQSPKPTPTYIGSVFGEVYGIEVVDVKIVNEYWDHSYTYTRLAVPEAGYVFLEVGIWFFKSGKLLLDNEELKQLSALDSNGKAYTVRESVIWMEIPKTENGEGSITRIVVHFSVPKDSTGFKLQYRDLPLIDLGL